MGAGHSISPAPSGPEGYALALKRLLRRVREIQAFRRVAGRGCGRKEFYRLWW
jgi:hypothetical protein